MAKRYFEFVEGSSSKFWEVWMDGNEVYTRYGKIGSSGQTTVKDQGSPAGAQKLYDKLVKEKTGKGYEEKTAGGAAAPAAAAAAPATKSDDFKTRWAAIAGKTGPDLVAALDQEWAFLVDTPKCKQALSYLLAKATGAELDIEERLVVKFDNQYDGETTVTCSPPATGDLKKFPKSWQKFMQHYDGMMFDHDFDVPSSFNGTSGSGGFEMDYLEEADSDLYEKMQEKDKELEVPIDLGQDWVVAHPFKKNKLGEPALYFFSHEGGGLDEAYPGDLGLTGVFLCLMAEGITGKGFMTTEAADDEGDDDGADDDGDGGGSGARRFEFSEDGSNKFWEIRVEGSSHTVRYGKIGTDGQTKTKDFGSAALAQKDADKLIAEKTKKGYEEV